MLPQFLDEARKQPVFTFVDSDLKFSKPEVRVTIDRDKAQTLGVSALRHRADAAGVAQRTALRLLHLYNGKQYDVIGQLTRDFRSRPGDLGDICRAHAGRRSTSVRLDNLVTLDRKQLAAGAVSTTTATRPRRSQATLAHGLHDERGHRALAASRGERRSTSASRPSLTGAARDFVESSSSLGWVFAARASC